MEGSIMKMVTCIMMMSIVIMGVRGDMAEKCTTAIGKLGSCLGYATGKADSATKDCCSSVSGIKESDPACLCFIIQQAHNGSAAIKSAGILEGRLLLLPSTCHLNNASITNCPKLLNLLPDSPDAKIFTDPPSTNGTTTTPTTPIRSSDKGSGSRIMNSAPYFQGLMMVVVVAVLPFTTEMFSF
ncbi:non-specific lipid transfer protein GPI-anchored 1 [Impatiens glandulifera]|uniref:non-specific lipid transfer protein GPI-anchored 1 n=1 Tax=Impatiens glandulifera TaxID=253017 RepID=UPI001FB07697|nr:non-specific lipid transfer protein GPI-anchored 1 [Impatiens glandulifera]